MNKVETFKSLEEKFLRHGYSYVGNDILEEILEWIGNNELFTGFEVVQDNKDRMQTRVTLKGFYEHNLQELARITMK